MTRILLLLCLTFSSCTDCNKERLRAEKAERQLKELQDAVIDDTTTNKTN